MTKIIRLFIIFALVFAFSSCKDKDPNFERYSVLQKKEENAIKAYINRNNIKVVKEFPTVWEPNIYYESYSGLYIHIEDEGDSTSSLNPSGITKVLIRTIEYELDEKNTIISSKMHPNEYPFPDSFNYGNPASAPNIGIYEAVGIMKNEGSKAKIIVPSALNTDTYKDVLKAVRYDIHLNFPK